MEYEKARKVEQTARIMKDSKSKKGDGKKPGGEGPLNKDEGVRSGWRSILQRDRDVGGDGQDFPEAEIIITTSNKPPMAAASKYDPDVDYSPQISALGKGVIAENIVRAAKESKVPVIRDEQLVSTLNKLRIGDGIPQELFEVVAEVLVFVCKSDTRFRDKFRLE